MKYLFSVDYSVSKVLRRCKILLPALKMAYKHLQFSNRSLISSFIGISYDRQKFWEDLGPNIYEGESNIFLYINPLLNNENQLVHVPSTSKFSFVPPKVFNIYTVVSLIKFKKNNN